MTLYFGIGGTKERQVLIDGNYLGTGVEIELMPKLHPKKVNLQVNTPLPISRAQMELIGPTAQLLREQDFGQLDIGTHQFEIDIRQFDTGVYSLKLNFDQRHLEHNFLIRR